MRWSVTSSPSTLPPVVDDAENALEAFEDKWETPLPDDWLIASKLGAYRPVPRLPAGGPQDHLHDERHRVAQLDAAKLVYYRGHFPTDEAAVKLLFLAIRNLEKRGKCQRV